MKVFPFVIQHCSHCIVLQERNNLGPAEVPFFILRQKSRFSSFFGAFYDCYEIAVLWFEQKNFLCFHKGRKQRCFLQSDRKPTMIKLFKLDCGTERLLYQMSSSRPFFLLSLFRSLPTGFFLCLDFTHRISSIYSNIIAPTE